MNLKNKFWSTTALIIASVSLSSCSENEEASITPANAQSAAEKDYRMASAEGMDGNIPNPCHMYYPNIPGELILENDQMVVQRFIIEPGQWEGIHRHPFDQLYVQVKGGEWTVKYGDEANTFISPDGEASWDG